MTPIIYTVSMVTAVSMSYIIKINYQELNWNTMTEQIVKQELSGENGLHLMRH